MDSLGDLFGGLGEVFGGIGEAAEDVGVAYVAGRVMGGGGDDADATATYDRCLAGGKRPLNINDL